MKGYVVRKGNQHYAVIYEGLDPITGRERRRWHPAGPDRAVAEALAHRLADERLRDRSPHRSSLTVGVYLTQRWLPANQARLRPSTWAGYDRNVRLHIVPRVAGCADCTSIGTIGCGPFGMIDGHWAIGLTKKCSAPAVRR